MPRSFDSSVDLPVTVEQVHSAFCDENYWQARVAAFQVGTATLDSLTVDPDDTVTVAVRLRVFRDRLPALVTRLSGGDLELTQTQSWIRIGGDRVRGEVNLALSRASVSAVGKGLLAPAGNGSRLDVTSTVKVKVPLVGGAIESFVGSQLGNDLRAFERFTTEWIAENR
jgi:Protein of unknown function (DUF2505)